MTNEKSNSADVIVIGGGAAGMMAAGRAARKGARVLLLEKTDSLGKKILVSGKTRCNLTNTADLKTFITMYGANGRFLYNALARFFRPELLAFFAEYGLAAKEERGGRVFPVSDDARDVTRALQKCLSQNNVRVIFNARVKAVIPGVGFPFTVQTTAGTYWAWAVILATGGASWPGTGSTGDGYAISQALEHTITPVRPALVPLIVDEQKLARSMQGVSLRNVRATAFQGEAVSVEASLIPSIDCGRGEKKLPRPPLIESRFGEMLFTHFGLGGPIILLMSLSVVDALKNGRVSILIDLKPALSREQLRHRLQTDLNSSSQKKIASILKAYLPTKMIEPLINLAGVAPLKPAHQIVASEREKIISLFKALRFNIQAPLPLEKAIVTAGGVALHEIDPRTMASKKCPGLYFCGEVMDIDANTGGYNLQAAFSTGSVAGESAALWALHSDLPKKNQLNP